MEIERLSMLDYLEGFPDSRDPRMIKHLLVDIITIAVVAVICGADNWEEIELFGRSKEDWFREFLKLPEGIPSHDTFNRVFAWLDPQEFQKRFMHWTEALRKHVESEVIAIDGKTARRSKDNGRVLHMVSAWASSNRLILGQVKKNDKSNEITAIPELLDQIMIKNCIVTIDAMGCQTAIAEKIIERKADYILALKGNQETLHDDIRDFFEAEINDEHTEFSFDFSESETRGHGRIDIRRCWATSQIDWLQQKPKWKNLQSVVMIESERHINNQVSKEHRFYISSCKPDAEQLNKNIQLHWGIENSQHWVLDIAFREDECRTRKDNAPHNFALIRHWTLNLLRQEKTSKKSIRAKRLKAGWDMSYFVELLKLAKA